MLDFQTFIAVITTILVFVTGVALKYESIYLRNYELHIPQWAGLSFAGVTFSFVALDQLLRGFVRLEEVQRRAQEEQRRVKEEQRRTKSEEQEARRTRIETRYRIALV